MPATLTDVLAEVTNFIARWTDHDEDFANWLAGTVTGGYNENGTISNGVAPQGGYYPLRNASGQALYFPCPAKLQGSMLKGDPARQDVSVFVQGVVGASERIALHRVPVAVTYNPAICSIDCGNAPTANATFTFKVNGAAWGTATILAGQTSGTFTISNPNRAAGSILEILGPASHDATLADVYLTLAQA